MHVYTFCKAVLSIVQFKFSVERRECDSLDCVGKYFASKEGDGSTVYEGLRGALMCMSMSSPAVAGQLRTTGAAEPIIP